MLAPAGASAAIPAPPVNRQEQSGRQRSRSRHSSRYATRPGVVLALTANPSANVNTVCAKYGAPLSPASAALRRAALRHHSLRSHATQVCVGAGCTYVWLFNEGGGWAYEESEAMPFPAYGHIEKGFADFARTPRTTPTVRSPIGPRMSSKTTAPVGIQIVTSTRSAIHTASARLVGHRLLRTGPCVRSATYHGWPWPGPDLELHHRLTHAVYRAHVRTSPQTVEALDDGCARTTG